MTQEEKQLLLVDLCARLPYGVKVKTSRRRDPVTLSLDVMTDFHLGCSVKPYLHPMSSMTEDEREEWVNLFNSELDKLMSIEDEKQAEDLAPSYFASSHNASVDWLNKKMFDHRGLIPMGLALEAPEGMYNTKN